VFCKREILSRYQVTVDVLEVFLYMWSDPVVLLVVALDGVTHLCGSGVQSQLL